ncbi:MAG TPA: GNAT family protein [Candidatus Eisenbacteria bacterium]|nr:GNAT family protein [Candidatus Eisenbacteria bacterium]
MTVHGIQGPRIRLVPFEKDYVDYVLRWFNDPEVLRYVKRVMPLHRVQEEQFVERMAQSKDDVVWAVLDENESPIGVSGLHGIDWVNRNAKTGTVIGERSVWRKGYGTEVMATRTKWAFEELGLHRLQSECYVENVASRRCLEKAGYQLIGTARRRMWRNGAWHDLLLFDILEEDWLAAHPRPTRPS